MITLVLEENDIWGFVDETLMSPTNATLLVSHKNKDVKVRMIVLDGVKNHVVPHLSKRILPGRCGRL